MSDYFEQVERELRTAMRRRQHLSPRTRPTLAPTASSAEAAEAPSRTPDRAQGTSRARFWSQSARALRTVPVLAASLVALGVAVVALIGLGGHARQTAASTSIPGRRQLIDALGALRRPQTQADLDPTLLARLNQHDGALGTSPDVPLIRLAATTAWGEKVFLVPMKPLNPGSPPRGLRRASTPGQRQHRALLERLFSTETLGVFTVHGRYGGSGECCQSLAQIEAGGAPSTGSSRPLHGSGSTRLISIVPDGVARVAFTLPRGLAGLYTGAPTYPHQLMRETTVHGNVAAVQLPRQPGVGRIETIWYASDGHVIKRIGTASPPSRALSQAPESAASRAAERDPSTPNRVWVTPRAGGTRTGFYVHFHVLLTGAFYRYTITGTQCPQLESHSGEINGGIHDIRGHIWSEPVWLGGHRSICPGTYHVSVAVTRLGAGPPLAHPAHPFGSATFIVKR